MDSWKFLSIWFGGLPNIENTILSYTFYPTLYWMETKIINESSMKAIKKFQDKSWELSFLSETILETGSLGYNCQTNKAFDTHMNV